MSTSETAPADTPPRGSSATKDGLLARLKRIEGQVAGGRAMLAMMGGGPNDMASHDHNAQHEGHSHGGHQAGPAAHESSADDPDAGQGDGTGR